MPLRTRCAQCGAPTPMPVEIVILDPQTELPRLYPVCSRPCGRALAERVKAGLLAV